MKNIIILACAWSLSFLNLFSQENAAEQNSEIQFYSKGAIGMLNCLYLLSVSVQGREKIDYEQSLCANIFEYWYLKKAGKIPENKTYEKVVVNLLITNKSVRTEILEDPLGRINPNGSSRSIGSGGTIIMFDRSNYDQLRYEFLDCIRKLGDDSENKR